jgi:DNA-binding LacI/PurR family transcriptional regulator
MTSRVTRTWKTIARCSAIWPRDGSPVLDTPLLSTSAPRAQGKPALDDPSDLGQIARVGLDWCDAQRGIPGIGTDWTAFIDRAVGHLASQGRRRAAMVHLTFGYDWVIPAWLAACRRHGIETCPAWVQPGSLTAGANLANLIHLLLDRPRAQRIDGLVIADDHLVAGVTAGCLEVGAELGGPERLSVVAHANFPIPQRGVRPATYLGFDARRIIYECIRALDGQRAWTRRNSASARLLLQSPVFEHELKPASAAGRYLVGSKP